MPKLRYAAWILIAASPWGCSPGGPSPAAVAKVLAHELAAHGGASRVAGESLLEPRTLAKFYAARRSMPAWDRNGVAEITQSIRGVERDGLVPADYHLAAIGKLAAANGAGDAATAARLDILMSDAVAAMADHMHYGRVQPARLNPEWNADPRDGAPPLETTLAAIAGGGSVHTAIERQRPDHFIYRGLLETYDHLRTIVANGGWPRVPAGRKLVPGVRDARIPVVRRRLRVSGEFDGQGGADSTRYDPALRTAVGLFQARHRLDDTGAIDAATVAAMNVSAVDRTLQVRANLERARWVLGGLGGDFMLVNLPAFKAYRIRDGRNIWEARTQIGQEALQTPTFRADIRTVVFNPDWTVPPTVIAQELLADMRDGKDILGDKGLVLYDNHNTVVDPKTVDWKTATPETFPYTIRQPAGDDNALGKVKFLFPNKYAIYLHDTPSRQLFAASRRTFSHGCIRIENPLELAEVLLRDQGWDAARIQSVIASGETQNVELQKPVPILIVYWTVSVGASGEVRYADDIYHLDPPLLAALGATR